jgi:hypothetical protein
MSGGYNYTLIREDEDGASVDVYTSEDTLNNPFLDPALATTTTTTTTLYGPGPAAGGFRREADPLYAELPGPAAEGPARTYTGYEEPPRAGFGIYDELPASSAGAGAPGRAAERQTEADDTASESQPVSFITGQLPDDFLRLTERVPVPRHPQGHPQQHAQHVRQGILRITVVQAKLAKNYGLMRMDPFCRFISGPFHKTSSVSIKGGKEPRWNQIIDV